VIGVTVPPCCPRCHVVLSETEPGRCKVCGADCILGVTTMVDVGKGTITIECGKGIVERPTVTECAHGRLRPGRLCPRCQMVGAR
jgi:hypothetical protein